MRDFVIHDFRRTASTLLHRARITNSDWIEKALAHERMGVRGVYNRAEYLNRTGERCFSGGLISWTARLMRGGK